MSTTDQLLTEADAASKTDIKRAEALYKQILATPKLSPNEGEERLAQTLRDQETALVNLGQLYRDQKYVDVALVGPSILTG
jgi:26S proteasome regulatory subunit N6